MSLSVHFAHGRVMEIIMQDAEKYSLHPITILSLLDKNQQRIACKVWLDQSFLDKCLISWDRINMLTAGYPTSKSNTRTFMTAAGIFIINNVLFMSGVMLLCLATNRTNSIQTSVTVSLSAKS